MARERLNEADALRLIVRNTVSQTGREFFQELVRNLAEAMDTMAAWVTEYLPEKGRLRALAFWVNGQYRDHYEHALPGTPCERVIHSKGLVHFPDQVITLFPEDPDLKRIGAVSYLGTPLLDPHNTVMGHLAVMDSRPLPKDARLLSLFEIFAARAAAEQRRLLMEEEVRWREEHLRTVLQSTMDGILVLNERLQIQQLNPAAERLFNCTTEDLQHKPLSGFLTPDCASRLDTLVTEVKSQPEGRRQLWIPQSFKVLRSDRTSFAAEATLSYFENRGAVFYTLILRNADQRFEAERRIQRLTEETEYLREAVREGLGMGEVIGRSRAMARVFESIERVAPTDTTVLVLGETGTGKELVARSIHSSSVRKDKALIRVNCAAIPAALMESEFFGHERGAFTGASTRREGRFTLADGGTLFLDEVGELPLDLQAKLLRVLQEGEFEPVGSAVTRKVDVRVIAATNRNLEELVQEGRFREDLLYRLNVFPILLPPLRERRDDIALLAQSFVARQAARMGRRVSELSEEDCRMLQTYRWPGNVRELHNVLERALILSNGTKIDLRRAMPVGVAATAGVSMATAPSAVNNNGHCSAEDEPRILSAGQIAALERANLQRALERAGGRVAGPAGAAALLGLAPSTLRSRMKALGLVIKA